MGFFIKFQAFEIFFNFMICFYEWNPFYNILMRFIENNFHEIDDLMQIKIINAFCWESFSK